MKTAERKRPRQTGRIVLIQDGRLVRKKQRKE